MTTATYQPASGIDTYIGSGSIQGPTTTYMLINTTPYNGLIKFDISDIDGSAICSSATMSLYSYSTAGTNGTIYAYSILVANNGWTEAGATGASKDGTNQWAGGANSICGVSGTDYNATPIGSCAWDETVGHENQFSLTPSVVESWFGVSNENYGMVLIAGAGADVTACSSDHATSSLRPKLSVTYTISGVKYRRTFSASGTRMGSRQGA